MLPEKGRLRGYAMRDSVSRTLIAFVLVQALFVVLLPLAIVASAQGLDVSVYTIAFEEKYRLLAQTEVATVLLFTLAIWIQRRWWLTGFLTSVPLIGLSVVLAPFYLDTGGGALSQMRGKAWQFFAGYAGLAIFLGIVFWFLAVLERRD